MDVKYYNVDAKIRANVQQLESNLEPNDAVVAVSYFGFPVEDTIVAFSKRCCVENITWIHDCAQAFSGADSDHEWANFRVFSPRKLVGVPDGGIAIPIGKQQWNHPPEPCVGIQMQDQKQFFAAQLACRTIRAQFPTKNDIWQKMYTNAEEMLMDPHRESWNGLSQLTQSRLETMDFDRIKVRRCRNFQVLERLLRLSSPSVYQVFDDDKQIAPFVFPLFIDRQDAFCTLMAKRGIFCPRLWGANGVVGLPCDQRYSISDMHLVANAAKSCMKELFAS